MSESEIPVVPEGASLRLRYRSRRLGLLDFLAVGERSGVGLDDFFTPFQTREHFRAFAVAQAHLDFHALRSVVRDSHAKRLAPILENGSGGKGEGVLVFLGDDRGVDVKTRTKHVVWVRKVDFGEQRPGRRVERQAVLVTRPSKIRLSSASKRTCARSPAFTKSASASGTPTEMVTTSWRAIMKSGSPDAPGVVNWPTSTFRRVTTPS